MEADSCLQGAAPRARDPNVGALSGADKMASMQERVEMADVFRDGRWITRAEVVSRGELTVSRTPTRRERFLQSSRPGQL